MTDNVAFRMQEITIVVLPLSYEILYDTSVFKCSFESILEVAGIIKSIEYTFWSKLKKYVSHPNPIHSRSREFG